MKTEKQIREEILSIETQLDLVNKEDTSFLLGTEKTLFRMAVNAAEKQIEILQWVLNDSAAAGN